MKSNKQIQRNAKTAFEIFDRRSLVADYRTLHPILKKGMTVLDIGCGTGAISKDIAKIVGAQGAVIGIDNTSKFIKHGSDKFKEIPNLKLLYADLFEFDPKIKFDLIISARVLQWLSTPKEALLKIKSMLKTTGQVSILDYNHDALEWKPDPPRSMKEFYKAFLNWRKAVGMNNQIAEDLPAMMEEMGFNTIEKINSDEVYDKNRHDFKSRIRIWSKVAESTQMVKEGYIENEFREKAIRDYNKWIETDAVSMTMKLNEVRGRIA